MHLLHDMVTRRKCKRIAKELLDLFTHKQVLKRKTGKNRAGGEKTKRNEHHHRALVRLRKMPLIVRTAMKGDEDQPPGIERNERSSDGGHREPKERHGIVYRIRRLDNGILGKIASGKRKSGKCQRSDQHCPIGKWELVLEAAHAPDVLFVVHRDDYRPGTEEQKRLEKGM